MDQLVLAAATALVTAMATDGWQEARAAVATVWHKVHPDQAPVIEAQLEELRGEVLAADEAGDARVTNELIEDWRRRLELLAADHPSICKELQHLADGEWTLLLTQADQSHITNFSQRATARGHGRVYQAGWDQHIY